MIRVEKISKADWANGFSEAAHKLAFEELKPADFDRIDYALLSIRDDQPVSYVQVRETDPRSVYWQFGGAFPWARGTTASGRSYAKMVEFQGTLCDRIVTYIKNTNYPMLKMALANGFIIIGTRTVFGETFIDLVKEFRYGNQPVVREHAEPNARVNDSSEAGQEQGE